MRQTLVTGRAMTFEPSGIPCSSCGTEIDLADGPVRMVGRPTAYPFCVSCWFDILAYLGGPAGVRAKKRDGKLYLWVEEA